jgi:hypothetical protein
MGLYDEIEIMHPIEIPSFIPENYRRYFSASFERNGFQTKDLEELMSHYLVTSGGEMYQLSYRLRTTLKRN